MFSSWKNSYVANLVCGKSGPKVLRAKRRNENSGVAKNKKGARKETWLWSSNDLLYGFNKSFYLHRKIRKPLSLNDLHSVNGKFLKKFTGF
jgi:hypothetical protein